VTGVLQPVFLGEEHLLNLVASGFQVPERQDLGRRPNIEVKIGGLEPIKGENASVDRVGLGEKAEIPGEAANPRSMGLVRGDPEFHAEIENMALIAAGRLADDEQRAEIGLGVASQFSEQRLADRFGFVGGDALLAGGQDITGLWKRRSAPQQRYPFCYCSNKNKWLSGLTPR
jgi:hypothetical protein